HDNTRGAILTSGAVRIAGNTVYGHTGGGAVGIQAGGGIDTLRNVVHSNTVGIAAGGSVLENRVYDNRDVGIVVNSASPVRFNVVYSNGVGIRTTASSN